MKNLFLLLVLACVTELTIAKDPATYRNTNELVWDKTFTLSVNRFFGPLRVSYFWANGLVSSQVSAGLGGPPDNVQKIEGTPLFLASACRPHSCDEKAAVVFRDAGSLIAFGLVHYPCLEESTKVDCSKHPILSILSKGKQAVSMVIAAIVDWAEGRVGKLNVIKTQVVR